MHALETAFVVFGNLLRVFVSLLEEFSAVDMVSFSVVEVEGLASDRKTGLHIRIYSLCLIAQQSLFKAFKAGLFSGISSSLNILSLLFLLNLKFD